MPDRPEDPQTIPPIAKADTQPAAEEDAPTTATTPNETSSSSVVDAENMKKGADVDASGDPNRESPQRIGATEKLVPVSEAIRYRRRARAAEEELAGLERELSTARGELGEARQTIEHLERRSKIDALLSESNTTDLGVARLLTEIKLHDMEEPDPETAVSELRREKPYLFASRGSRISVSAMAPNGYFRQEAALEHAADQAASTGDRRDLLQYLRARRRA